MEPSVLANLRICPICGGLPEEHLGALLKDATRQRFRSGDVIFRKGEPADRFFALIEGHVALYLGAADEPSNLATIVGPGQTFAEAAICGHCAYPVTAEALGPTVVLAIPGEKLRASLGQRFDLVLAILSQMSMRLRVLLRQVADLKMQSATKRLASFLIDRAGIETGRARIRLPYDKKILASELGMQPETLSRAFTSLRSFGVIVSKVDNVVELADAGALAAFCRRDDTERAATAPTAATGFRHRP